MNISEKAYTLMNMAFDISGIIILMLIAHSMLKKPFKDRNKSTFLIAVILHVIALFMMVAGETDMVANAGEEGVGYMIAALIAELCSIAAVIAVILMDEDGRVHLVHRRSPLSVAVVICLIIPNMIAYLTDTLTGVVRIGGIAYAVSLYLIYVHLRDEYEKALSSKEREMDAAQAKVYAQQMQPHFIFNSLMAIESLVRTDPGKAEESIENLSGYLRGNIDALMSDKHIPFNTELAHIREYVALELADPDRQFEMEYELEETDFVIPPLTIQPIVENAIKHGALSRKDGQGRVKLTTQRHGDMIRITVEDNGTGENDHSPAREHEGVGMKSAENRIVTRCKGSFNFEKGETGAKTVILIPAAEDGEG